MSEVNNALKGLGKLRIKRAQHLAGDLARELTALKELVPCDFWNVLDFGIVAGSRLEGYLSSFPASLVGAPDGVERPATGSQLLQLHWPGDEDYPATELFGVAVPKSLHRPLKVSRRKPTSSKKAGNQKNRRAP